MELTRRGVLKLFRCRGGHRRRQPGRRAEGRRCARRWARSRSARLKLSKPVYSGTSNKVLEPRRLRSLGRLGEAGQDGHSILFAHRTSAGGPLRNAHKLKVGDTIVVNRVTYRVRAKEIIKSNNRSRALSYGKRGKRLSLITCTKPNGLPTSTKYRLIIRATA